MSASHFAIPDTPVIACRECDLLHCVRTLNQGETARCARCGALLYQEKGNSINRPLALVISGLILFGFANAYPILSLKVIGTTTSNTLLSGVFALYHSGLPAIALLVLLTSILVPLIKLLILLYILYPLAVFKTKPPGLAPLFRAYLSLDCWGMLEVYMLSIGIAISRLDEIASVQRNTGLYALIGLFLVTFSASRALDPRIIWEKLEMTP